MGVRTSESVKVPASADAVFPFVSSLDRYPAWMRLVHAVEPEPAGDEMAWTVELRAQVGPFARSKRLRMVRTVHEPDRSVTFERAETDGRKHAPWTLRVELDAVDESSTDVTMHLAYDGALWTGGLLDRVLDEEIRRGRHGLAELVAGSATE